MQQFVSFATTTKPNVIEPQGPEKMREKIFRSWCLDGVATINIVMQWQTTLWPENMVTLSRQYCRVPGRGRNKSNIIWIRQTSTNNLKMNLIRQIFKKYRVSVLSPDLIKIPPLATI